MLFYLHGGDLPFWLINLIFLLFILAPIIVISLPFLFFYHYFKRKEDLKLEDLKLKENKSNEDKHS